MAQPSSYRLFLGQIAGYTPLAIGQVDSCGWDLPQIFIMPFAARLSTHGRQPDTSDDWTHPLFRILFYEHAG
jgi:hypothetical protein